MPEIPDFRLPTDAPSSRSARQRAIGCLVGAAVGDALGAPFEFKPAGRYSDRFPRPLLSGRGEMIGGGGFGWDPGEFTDDTQMALVMALSLLDSGGYDPDHLWSGWRRWASTAADVGMTTRAALSFDDWRHVRHRHPDLTASNGALMRSFPLAVATLHVDDDTARDMVRHQAALTHAHPDAGWGAWLAVAIMRAAMLGGDALEAIDRELVGMPAEQAVRFGGLLSPDWTPADAQDTNGSVWVCLAQAVWALRHHGGFESAVTAAVDLGHDADTVGCVTGALAGAVYGIQAIPSRWATYVHGRVSTAAGEMRFDLAGLQAMVARLMGFGVATDQEVERPKTPVEVAPGLYAADLGGAATVPSDWAVVSLCRTGDRFAGHPVRRQLYLVDQAGDHNHRLDHAVADAVDSIDAFLADGLNVVVHCHGGRSRTGLVLKAWKMRTDGLAHAAAHDWLVERWPWVERWNADFEGFLDTRWPAASAGGGF